MSNQREMDADELKSLREKFDKIIELWETKIISDDNDIILDEDAAITITTLLAGV